jgi:hypothetical protein
LIQVNGLTHAIRTHAHVTLAQGDITRQFAFYREVPLRGLRVTVVRERVLVKIASSGNRGGSVLRASAGELIRGLAIRERITGGAHNRNVNVRSVERELAKVGHGEDAESSAGNRFAVTERAVGKTHARLKILAIELAQTWTEPDFVGVFDGSARHARLGAQYGNASEGRVDDTWRTTRIGRIVRVGGIATVDRRQKSRTRLIADGNNDSTVANVERRKIAEIAVDVASLSAASMRRF